MNYAEIALFASLPPALGGILWWFWRILKREIAAMAPDPRPQRVDSESVDEVRAIVQQEMEELEEDFAKLRREMHSFIEYAEERVKDGNKVWRRIRARESAEERSEGEEEGWELPEGDASPGPGQGVLPLRDAVGPHLEPDQEGALELEQALLSRMGM